MSFPKARDQQQAFKHSEITGYAAAFIRRALSLYNEGVSYCGSDDIEVAVSGSGIAGSAITMLINANVIVQHHGCHPDADPPVSHGRRKSKRKERNGAWVGTYEINSFAIAQSFLRANGGNVEDRQGELF